MASARQAQLQRPDQQVAGSSLFDAPQKPRLIFCLLLVLSTLVLYNSVTHAPFLNVDDDGYVTENPVVRSGLNWHSVEWAFTTTSEAGWQPITWLSHELDCQLFGMNPAGPHMVNVLLHAMCAVILFLILSNVTGMVWRSLLVAAFFALHPINVESVAWIAERKNVLSMLFFLLALMAYGWYARRPSIGPYAAVTVLYALALMAKPQVITFPFALLLLDYWPLRRIGTDSNRFLTLLWEKLPWFALSAISVFITMKTQSASRHEGIPPWMRLANAALSYMEYLGKTFWPADLAPMYPHPGGSISVPAAILSAVAILAITILVVVFRARRYLLVGWLWFLGTLVPMIGLVQVGVQAMADRYAYIPLLGIFVILCWGGADLLRHWHLPNRAAALISVVALLALAFALHRQVAFWGNNVTLWRHTLDITERNYIAEDSLATALVAEGKIDDAIPYFRDVQANRPGDPLSLMNIASYEQQHGNYRAALKEYQQVLQLTANVGLEALVHTNAGYAHFALHENEVAKQEFETALRLEPDDAPAYVGLGLIAQRSGDLQRAAENLEHAIDLQPAPATYLLLAEVLDAAGQNDSAKAARDRAAQITAELNRGSGSPIAPAASANSH